MTGPETADAAERGPEGFRNPAWMTGETGAAGASRLRLLPILRWRLGGSRSAWPAQIVDPAPAGDPWAEPPAGSVSVTFIGHSCFLIRVGGLTVLTDPMFSARASPVRWAGPRRARAPGRPLGALPPVDLVLLSHNHYDHLDLPSLRALQRHSAPQVITPLGNAVHVRKATGKAVGGGTGGLAVRELDWWQRATLPPPHHACITAVPVRHFSARGLGDAGRSLWAGFMLECGGIRLLFAGDSGDGAHWRRIRDRLGAPDIALLPIGAYAPRSLMRRVHMDPAEAVRAHQTLEAGLSIGMHFGTFQLTDEPIGDPERRLAVERGRHGVEDDAFVTLGFGECRLVAVNPDAELGGPGRVEGPS